ncbi:methylhydantoinase [Azorhizobium oxalatiphilum]|uniref:Methylhydantoinase n=1 Tax=Azorhizobium oxalatiphilum TaxID=980631 RepID=A0A917F3P1_9HYPH|nr:hydantoinase/oxoprolinase family protein [Azorhizobium oxalatiphilum]GGF50233.1 methylhydantoinase [Azorhizobium oxalatiphilum]
MKPSRFLVGIDVGGTFTDLAVYDAENGATFAVKVPSNRAAPDVAVIGALDKAELAPEQVAVLVHGTTVATNALLERRGSKIAFITTEGFRDVLELGRTTRLVPRTLYDPYFKRSAPLVERRHRLTVPERTEADGSVSLPLDEAAIEQLAQALAVRGDIEAVSIGFINAFRNPANEEAAARVFRRHFAHVTTSTQVLNEIREFERFSAAAINGYVQPVMAAYVERLTQAVKARNPDTGFYTVASHGGLLSTTAVMSEPVRTVLSGPAAGVAAAVHLAQAVSQPNLITYDMGGTSTDVALIADAQFPLKRETLLDGLVVRLPQLEIHTVGAGGGSIAALDAGGSLQLGPESAGAVPGPAAYGRGGTRPTVTDANVVLGRLGSGQELGRSLRIDKELAVEAMNTIAVPAALAAPAMAEAVLALGIARMASAVHEISVARGFDPRDFALLCYGGAGPLHACEVAAAAGIAHVIVPPAPGAFSAFGALCSTLAKDKGETVLGLLDADLLAGVEARFQRLAAAIRTEFSAEGAAVERLAFERQFDLRYQGQAHELTIIVPEGASAAEVIELFETAFEREYGRRDRDRATQLVNIRLVGRIPIETPAWASSADGSGTAAGTRTVVHGGSEIACPVWNRDDLRAETKITGPAIIEEMSSTTFLPPGWRLTRGAIGELNLVAL